MNKEKYGFVYLWYDKKHKRYYVGCRWGNINDGYVCSSSWMRQAYGGRPKDFKRRILKTNILTREELYNEEQRWLYMIKEGEISPKTSSPRYYNLNIVNNKVWHSDSTKLKTIGQKISAKKLGKSNGPCTPERALNISNAKKGVKFTEEHKQKLSESRKGKPRSKESKRKTTETLKAKWASGEFNRPRAVPKTTMTRKDQDKLNSKLLKERWADPIWAANQKEKLKQAHQKRKNINSV